MISCYVCLGIHYDYEVDFGWEDNFGFVESVDTDVVIEVSWRICCLYFA